MMLLRLGLTGKDRAAKRIADQVPEQRAANAVLLFRGADHARGKNIERVRVELGSLP
jgi:hypothetical protein